MAQANMMLEREVLLRLLQTLAEHRDQKKPMSPATAGGLCEYVRETLYPPRRTELDI